MKFQTILSKILEQPLPKFLRKTLFQILQNGPIPKHVAFIMDGNRRYAKALNAPPNYGHFLGYRKLEQVLEWCMELGVQVVTVYAFSIENFKRPKDEVDTLMNLAKEKLTLLCKENQTVQKYGVSIRILGDISLLPEDVQKVVHQVTELTKDNQNGILNICMPYTSTEEISTCFSDLINSNHSGSQSIITHSLIEKSLYTAGCPDLDLLIRTSGETRLSDFLTWQSSKSTLIQIIQTYWPSFSLWDFYSTILHYQSSYDYLQNQRFSIQSYLEDLDLSS